MFISILYNATSLNGVNRPCHCCMAVGHGHSRQYYNSACLKIVQVHSNGWECWCFTVAKPPNLVKYIIWAVRLKISSCTGWHVHYSAQQNWNTGQNVFNIMEYNNQINQDVICWYLTSFEEFHLWAVCNVYDQFEWLKILTPMPQFCWALHNKSTHDLV